MNNLPRPHLSPRSMLPTLRYHGQNPLQPLALPLPRTMPSLHPTVPTQPTTPRMPTPAAQAIPTTPSRNTTIRRHNISRKCIHCKVPHIGGPLHCKVNKMRMRPFTTTTASTQTGNYTCSTCVLPPTSPNATLPAPFDFTDTPDPASPLPAPSNYTYSSVGPLSPYLTQTSPPSMTTSPAPPTPTSATSQATKPSVSNVGPLVPNILSSISTIIPHPPSITGFNIRYSAITSLIIHLQTEVECSEMPASSLIFTPEFCLLDHDAISRKKSLKLRFFLCRMDLLRTEVVHLHVGHFQINRSAVFVRLAGVHSM